MPAEKLAKPFASVMPTVIRVVVRRLVAHIVPVGRCEVEPTAPSQNSRRLRDEGIVVLDVLDDFDAHHAVEGLAGQAAVGHVFKYHGRHVGSPASDRTLDLGRNTQIQTLLKF